MADDPSKTGNDRKTVSEQDHEIRHLKEKFQKEFPSKSMADIEEAIAAAKRAVAPSESREKIEIAVRKSLS
jgi:hypothetical protein